MVTRGDGHQVLLVSPEVEVGPDPARVWGSPRVKGAEFWAFGGSTLGRSGKAGAKGAVGFVVLVILVRQEGGLGGLELLQVHGGLACAIQLAS